MDCSFKKEGPQSISSIENYLKQAGRPYKATVCSISPTIYNNIWFKLLYEYMWLDLQNPPLMAQELKFNLQLNFKAIL